MPYGAAFGVLEQMVVDQSWSKGVGAPCLHVRGHHDAFRSRALLSTSTSTTELFQHLLRDVRFSVVWFFSKNPCHHAAQGGNASGAVLRSRSVITIQLALPAPATLLLPTDPRADQERAPTGRVIQQGSVGLPPRLLL